MKHQYFGDINDFRKYGLLRGLARHSRLSLGVWWMLTPDDGRTDGNFTRYLSERERWRHLDPELFDELAETVPKGRSVSVVPALEMLKGARFVEELVPDNARARAEAFQRAHDQLKGSGIIFADPDNGLTVPSCPPGRKDSGKYVQLTELAALYSDGASLLVYQHFPRAERNAFVARTSTALMEATGAQSATCFRTSHVAFFLLPQESHAVELEAAALVTADTWKGEFGVTSFQPWKAKAG